LPYTSGFHIKENGKGDLGLINGKDDLELIV
jgi:hypothetical protein